MKWRRNDTCLLLAGVGGGLLDRGTATDGVWGVLAWAAGIIVTMIAIIRLEAK